MLLAVVAFVIGAALGFVAGFLCFRKNKEKFERIEGAIKGK